MNDHPIAPKDIQAEMKRLVKTMPPRPPRDPARITGMLKALEREWREWPDQRLGQIIVNATRYYRPSLVCPEVFYIEDDELLKGFEQMAKAHRKTKATRPPRRKHLNQL